MIAADKKELLKSCANWMRRHSIMATAEAGSGHPSTCLSAADLISAIFFEAMRYDPQNPKNPDNDRFVLSKGHAAPILYAAWSLAGVIPTKELLNLRKITSNLEGHPTPHFSHAEGATGSLGQGLSIATGIALAGRLDKRDYRVYALLGDGEIMEGAVWEAAALAAHYKLDHLIAVVDVNRLGQSQQTSLGHDTAAYKKRFEAFGWTAVTIDGHNFTKILESLRAAQANQEKPFVIVAKTLKGKGVSFIENKDGWHGKPLKKGEELEKALTELQGEEPPIPVAMRVPVGSGVRGQGSEIKEKNYSFPLTPHPSPLTPHPYKVGD
ncbi:MAG: transketolase, partial [Elusimicrobia bacterium]|nr:transketolase [Elusimicrobiota bacterium]